MKRFIFSGFVFAFVCGCHINGVRSQECNDGYYVNENRLCTPLPVDYHSTVVKDVPGLGRCGAVNTALKVKSYGIGRVVKSISQCKQSCESDSGCAYYMFDHSNKEFNLCWHIGVKSIGNRMTNIVIGPDECPENDGCQHLNVDYRGARKTPVMKNVRSPKDCQKLCRGIKYEEGRPLAYTYGLDSKRCFCKDFHYFKIATAKGFVSGDVVCRHCFGYHTHLIYLKTVDNGGPNPYLVTSTVEACQSSCQDNILCDWFQFLTESKNCYHKSIKTAELPKNNVVYASRHCDLSCYCDVNGVIDGDVTCDLVGNCKCNEAQGFTGKDCSICKLGYYRKGNTCRKCGCNPEGTKNGECDGNGKCKCLIGYSGNKCGTKERVIIIGDMGSGEKREYVFGCLTTCTVKYIRVESDGGSVDVQGNNYFNRGRFCRGMGQDMPKQCVFSESPTEHTIKIIITSSSADPGKNVRFFPNIGNYLYSYLTT